MKSVLISIQPYWVFLIIARLMGWDVPHEKTIEVRKSFPRGSAWSKKTLIYCSKSMRSFKRIPVQYQPFMKQLLGKVIGEFVCDDIDQIAVFGRQLYCEKNTQADKLSQMCLTIDEVIDYLGEKNRGFDWHISDLKIYDESKELQEFYKPVKYDSDGPICGTEQELSDICEWDCETVFHKKQTECTLAECPKLQGLYRMTRPPQSWCYVEEI